jgi:1-acyl-sn-glycerol-3-phosphate acyltransferase
MRMEEGSTMSDSRTQVRVSALGALETIGWRLLNFAQACFLAFWTGLMVSSALLLLCLVWSPRRGPLWMARRMWAPPLLAASGAKLDVRGLANLEGLKSAVFVCNHQSMIDIAVAFAALPVSLRFVAKRVLLYVPFIGWYLWGMGMVTVDRSNAKKAIATLNRATALFDQGAFVMTFAEGTRSRDGRVLPFKKGPVMLALQSGVPIVPMAIEGATDVLPSDGFGVRPGTIRVNVGAPVDTSALTDVDRDALTERVRNDVIDLHVAIGGAGGDKRSG